jgi:hypothetical protein
MNDHFLGMNDSFDKKCSPIFVIEEPLFGIYLTKTVLFFNIHFQPRD